MRWLRKFPDWLIYLILLVVIMANIMNRGQEFNTPMPPPELGPALPNTKPSDPTVLVEIDAPASGIGTAFAVDSGGKWMTARHVVDSCDQVGLVLSRGQYVKMDKVMLSPDADIALLTSRWKRKPLARDLGTRRQIGERGFFIGFPQGQPGEVAGKLLGRHRMVIRGRYRSSEPILAWAEIGRTQGLIGSLGGISGAPVFDNDGELIGLVSAESPRRGRVYTVAPRSLANALTPLSKKPERNPINFNNYGQRADSLRRSRRVAKVVCLVD